MKNNYNSFRKNLFLFLLPLLIPLVSFGFFSQFITKQYFEEELKINNANLLKQTRENLELIFNELDSLNLTFSTNFEITVKLKNILNKTSSTLNYEEYKVLTTISNFITAPANARPYIHSIYVYMDNDLKKFLTSTNGLVNLNNFYDTSWYDNYLTSNQKEFFWTEKRNIKNYDFEKTNTEILTVYRSLHLPGYKEKIGVIVLNVYADYLQKHLNNLVTHPEQRIIITNKENHFIFENKPIDFTSQELSKLLNIPDPVFNFRSQENNFIVSQLFSEKYGWKYLSIVPYSTLYQVIFKLQNLTILFSVFSFLLGLLLTYWLSKKNHRQLESIVSIIKSAESGQELPQPPDRIKDEYGYIAYNILTTFIEQNYLKVQLSERKYKLNFMELLALQSQINPHFLFNVLETIKWKTMQYTNKPNEASKMVEYLSDILRYSLESPGKKVTLWEELYNTRSYIKIQKVRFEDKFDVYWEYNEASLEYLIIRLILQPLIENAIQHGIRPLERKCYIKVKIIEQNEKLKIAVIDNGAGIDPDKLKILRDCLIQDNNYSSEHLGLYNTNKRIKLTYGEEYGLKIRSKKGWGTAIYLQIPIETATLE